ncbi:hypothetical protein [Desulforapulum autotrophicum]|nr:hypothetical protein [Desulforapulum autotrophicum]
MVDLLGRDFTMRICLAVLSSKKTNCMVDFIVSMALHFICGLNMAVLKLKLNFIKQMNQKN